MNAFTYSSAAQEIIFGPGSLDSLSAAAENMTLDRILICTIPRFRRNGLAARVELILGDRLAGTYAEVAPHVPEEQVNAALAMAIAQDADGILGLGGGSPIGMAKAVSMALENQRSGDPARIRMPTDQPLVPVIAVPTTYAGSEVTPIYGVTRQVDGGSRKFTYRDPKITPKLAIYDPELTLDLPPEMTASSGINALAHCIEAVYSIEPNPVATAAALEGVHLIHTSLPRAVSHGHDLAARTGLLEGAYLAGTAIATTKLGLHHGLCHVLGGSAGVPHGIANAIILPHAIRFNASGMAAELSLVAAAMGITGASADELAEKTVRRVYDLITGIGLPQRLRDVGVHETDLPALAQAALSSAAVRNNPVRIMDAAQIETVFRAAY